MSDAKPGVFNRGQMPSAVPESFDVLRARHAEADRGVADLQNRIAEARTQRQPTDALERQLADARTAFYALVRELEQRYPREYQEQIAHQPRGGGP